MMKDDGTGQLEFDWGQTPLRQAHSPGLQDHFVKKLHAQLEEKTGLTVSLTITDNLSRMISFKRKPSSKEVTLRLHHMFLEAPDSVIKDIAQWILHPRSRKYPARFQRFIDNNKNRIRKDLSRQKVRVQGKFYNLKSLYDEINSSAFNNRVTAGITWGRHTHGSLQSISLGTYRRMEHMIRIHPRLDQHFVPIYVIRHIVYHEMLHSIVPITKSAGGQRQIHSATFKKEERKSPDFEAAEAWLKDLDNLGKLLQRSRASKG